VWNRSRRLVDSRPRRCSHNQAAASARTRGLGSESKFARRMLFAKNKRAPVSLAYPSDVPTVGLQMAARHRARLSPRDLFHDVLVGKSSKGLNVALWQAGARVARLHVARIGVVGLRSPPTDPLIAADETNELKNLVRRHTQAKGEHIPATMAFAICLAEPPEVVGVVQRPSRSSVTSLRRTASRQYRHACSGPTV